MYQVFQTLKSPPYQIRRPKIMYMGMCDAPSDETWHVSPSRNIWYGILPFLLSLDHAMGIENHPWYVNSQSDVYISFCPLTRFSAPK